MAENTLEGKRIAFLVAPEGTEQVALADLLPRSFGPRDLLAVAEIRLHTP